MPSATACRAARRFRRHQLELACEGGSGVDHYLLLIWQRGSLSRQAFQRRLGVAGSSVCSISASFSASTNLKTRPATGFQCLTCAVSGQLGINEHPMLGQLKINIETKDHRNSSGLGSNGTVSCAWSCLASPLVPGPPTISHTELASLCICRHTGPQTASDTPSPHLKAALAPARGDEQAFLHRSSSSSSLALPLNPSP